MTLFAYRAMNSSGFITRGVSEAPSPIDLEARLKRLGLDLINAAPVRKRLSLFTRRLSIRERMHLCFHLEQLMRAGVPLLDALADLRESAEGPYLRDILTRVLDRIESGLSLSQALAEHPRDFDAVFCALVRAGECMGRLPEVMLALHETLRREDKMRAFMIKLVLYPAFVLATTLLAVAVAMLYVVPELSRLFQTMGMSLPLYTRALIAVSAWATRYWPLLLSGILMLALTLPVIIRKNARVAHQWDRVRLALPFTGAVHHQIVLARFANLFAMMYASGIPVMDILHTAQDTVGNRVLRQALERIEQNVADGHQISNAFAATSIFPPLVIRMLRVGEQTGALDRALENVRYFFERDVRESVARLQTALEPLLILLLGGLMLWVALSVLGPIYDVLTRMTI